MQHQATELHRHQKPQSKVTTQALQIQTNFTKTTTIIHVVSCLRTTQLGMCRSVSGGHRGISDIIHIVIVTIIIMTTITGIHIVHIGIIHIGHTTVRIITTIIRITVIAIMTIIDHIIRIWNFQVLNTADIMVELLNHVLLRQQERLEQTSILRRQNQRHRTTDRQIQPVQLRRQELLLVRQ